MVHLAQVRAAHFFLQTRICYLLPIRVYNPWSHDTDANYWFLGRTTFVNTLCGKDVLVHKDSDDPTDAHVEEGVKIKPITVGKIDQVL